MLNSFLPPPILDGEICRVNTRPGLADFLSTVFSRYDCYTFTAAMQLYAEPLLVTLDTRVGFLFFPNDVCWARLFNVSPQLRYSAIWQITRAAKHLALHFLQPIFPQFTFSVVMYSLILAEKMSQNQIIGKFYRQHCTLHNGLYLKGSVCVTASTIFR